MKLSPSTRAEHELRQAGLALAAAEQQSWTAMDMGSEELFRAKHALRKAQERFANAEAAVAALGGK